MKDREKKEDSLIVSVSVAVVDQIMTFYGIRHIHHVSFKASCVFNDFIKGVISLRLTSACRRRVGHHLLQPPRQIER